MAGRSQRFIEAGYTIPKYMIEVKEKTIFNYAISSLKNFIPKNGFIFITDKNHFANEFVKNECAKLNIKKYKIIELEKTTDGQATTALLAESVIDDNNESILIYNIDTYVNPDALSPSLIKGEGWVPSFRAEGNHWSFVEFDEKDKVKKIEEKIKISDYATIGLYYFSSFNLFQLAYNNYFSNNPSLVIKEKYVAPLYKYLIDNLYSVYTSVIQRTDVNSLGTPKELAVFQLK